MERPVNTIIDGDLCIGCGECVAVCPSQTISMQNGKAAVTGAESLNCGHCVAVCPAGAIKVASLEPDNQRFATFTLNPAWLPHGQYNLAELARLMGSRRSCRNYRPDPVSPEMLCDLAKLGLTAPSATNSQTWAFTILPSREKVLAFAQAVGRFFKKTNAQAESTVLRKGLKLFGKPQLDWYYREYYQKVKDGLAEWEAGGRELLFHGATAAMVVSSRPGGSMPADDALLATQNILLAAHAMGLGSCLIGFAVSALAADPALKKPLGLAPAEKVHAVIGLGHPAEKYRQVAGRKAAPIRVL